jgi:hypothetical protein
MITLDEVMAAVQEDNNIGFCLSCGEQADCVEPDAHGYECECCGEHAVMGAEEILLTGAAS